MYSIKLYINVKENDSNNTIISRTKFIIKYGGFHFLFIFFFIRNYEDVAYFVYKLLTYIVDIGFDIARLEHSYTQRNCQFEYRSIVFQGISKFS